MLQAPFLPSKTRKALPLVRAWSRITETDSIAFRCVGHLDDRRSFETVASVHCRSAAAPPPPPAAAAAAAAAHLEKLEEADEAFTSSNPNRLCF